jgi:hypothetical protein
VVAARAAVGRNVGRKRECDLKRSRAPLFLSVLNHTLAVLCVCESCTHVHKGKWRQCARAYLVCAHSLWKNGMQACERYALELAKTEYQIFRRNQTLSKLKK